MNNFELKRLQTAISYYLQQQNQTPTQEQIYKFLLLSDIISIQERGKPIFNLRQIAKEDIKLASINNLLNLKYFSKTEIEILNKAIEMINKNVDIDLSLNYESYIGNEDLRDIFEFYNAMQELKQLE